MRIENDTQGTKYIEYNRNGNVNVERVWMEKNN